MKKLLFVMFIFLPVLLFSQQASPPKYALVIGNGAYSNLTRLANPANDANDVADVLQGLGFTVDKIIDGNLIQMENAVIKLKSCLSTSDKAYGFFFYAGHGVQSNGENFLIPIDADIPSESFLRNRAVSVQELLDELNNARNGLNVVVLDACRDNPFGWARGGSRGLAVISGQPADSIIVYATSAGQRASDGQGRNGLFTSQLLKNLKDTSLEVKDIFNRTGADVTQASNRQQIPAVYNQFFGVAYLGQTNGQSITAQSTPKTVTTSNQNPGGMGTNDTQQIPQAAAPNSQGLSVEGTSVADKFHWLETNAASNTEYRVEVKSNETLSTPNLSYTSTPDSKATGSGTNLQAPQSATASGIPVEGNSLSAKFQWLEENAANNTEYRIEVPNDETLNAPVLSYPRRRNVTIRLISTGGEKVLSLTGNGSLFVIESDVTLILDSGITLQGHEKNKAALGACRT